MRLPALVILALTQLAFSVSCVTLPETAPNRSAPPSASAPTTADQPETIERIAYQVPLDAFTRNAPALNTSLNNVRSYQVACGTTATPITDGMGQSAILIWVNSATPVYIGGATVTTTTAGFPVCTLAASCPYASIALDAKYPYCRVAAGSVTIKVLAGLQ